MLLSVITLCKATVLFFELLVPSSPDEITRRNPQFFTHSIYQIPNLQGTLQDIYMGGDMSFDTFSVVGDITVFD